MDRICEKESTHDQKKPVKVIYKFLTLLWLSIYFKQEEKNKSEELFKIF